MAKKRSHEEIENINGPMSSTSIHGAVVTYSLMLALCILSRSFLCTVCSKFQTLSCLPCAFCFVPAYAKFAHKFLTLCNLSLAFLADLTPSDSTALIRFIAFSLSAFRLDRKT